jgi:hypothetical protein
VRKIKATASEGERWHDRESVRYCTATVYACGCGRARDLCNMHSMIAEAVVGPIHVVC